MTRTLDLSPEQEQALERKARRAGMDVDAYLNRVIQKVTTTRKRASTNQADRPEGYKSYWTEEDRQEATHASMKRFIEEEEAEDA